MSEHPVLSAAQVLRFALASRSLVAAEMLGLALGGKAEAPMRTNALIMQGRLALATSNNVDSLAEAGRLFASAAVQGPQDPGYRHHHEYLINGLIATGQPELAIRALTSSEEGLETDLQRLDTLNPWLFPDWPGASANRWGAAIAQLYESGGFSAPGVTSASEPVLYGLGSTAAMESTGGPLVSVVMTVKDPDEAFEWAVRSVMEQTYRDWELIIVDDGSNPVAHEYIDRVAELDPRAKLYRYPENEGTYARRNTAMRVAQGEFITFHDADDWMHPQRLASQVEHLRSDRSLHANHVMGVRVNKQLGFVTRRGVDQRPAAVTLLARTESLQRHVGEFDPVRNGADIDFRMRLEAATQSSTLETPSPLPLLFARADQASITGQTLSDGWIDPGLAAYRSAYRGWIDDHRSADWPGPLTADQARRRFPGPPSITGEDSANLRCDLIYVMDPRRAADSEQLAHQVAEEWRSLSSRGVVVGLRPSFTVHRTSVDHDFHAELQRLISDGTVALVGPGQSSRARDVVIRHRDAVLGATDVSPPIECGKVLVVDEFICDDPMVAERLRDAGRKQVARIASAWRKRRVSPSRWSTIERQLRTRRKSSSETLDAQI